MLNRIVWDVGRYGGGVPVLRGTRIPVSTILSEITVDKVDEVIKDLKISEEDLRACFLFASYSVKGMGAPLKGFDLNKLTKEEGERGAP